MPNLAICIGKDTPTHLYMTLHITKQNHFKDPSKFLNNFNNQISPNNRQAFMDEKYYLEQTHMKNDYYNFETVFETNRWKQFLYSKRVEMVYPIYILKDGKWFYCCPENDMLFVPIENYVTPV